MIANQRRGLVNRLSGASLMGALLSTVGCINVPPPKVEPEACKKQVVTLSIYAADLINPNQGERPRPVVVRLYQLARDTRMLNAKYTPILKNDAKVLKDDLMSMEEVIVYPNDRVQIKFERNPEAQSLVGAAMFHDPRGHSWKTYYTFPPMPDTPAACGSGGAEEDPEKPQAFPVTEFFVSERKIDNGSQFDASMFPKAQDFRTINLPKRSAAPDAYAAGPAAAKSSGKK
jgi:type VI secretion system protein VasD